MMRIITRPPLRGWGCQRGRDQDQEFHLIHKDAKTLGYGFRHLVSLSETVRTRFRGTDQVVNDLVIHYLKMLFVDDIVGEQL